MMRIVPLTSELLSLAITLERDPLVSEMASSSIFMERALIPQLSFAALDGGYILGAGGLIPMWPGRAEAWLLVTVHARRRDLVAALAVARRFFDARQRQPAFRRIEIFVRAKLPGGDRFARAMGFQREDHSGLVGWWPNGDDCYLYSRIGGPY